MGDKVKILEDLATLTKMCHSKSDGASLKIEEEEINAKIQDLKTEIEEIKATSEEDNYDTSAEMADRNIEIITKKLIQTLKNELKSKNIEMNGLKINEEETSNNLNSAKNTKQSYEKYIASMQDRISTSTDNDVITRYSALINTTQEKINKLDQTIEKMNNKYNSIQDKINTLSEEISQLEKTLSKKQEQLAEAQKNLENKEVYIDKNKANRTAKKIEDLQERINKHLKRLEEIYKDPKYLEVKIKDIITNNEDPFNARSYLIQLISMSNKQPYMNVDTDNALEEELLRATQARDSFATEIDQKTYDVMDTVNPEQIRIEYLNSRIDAWNNEVADLQNKIAMIDKDEQFHYEEKAKTLDELIESLKTEVEDYKKAYEEESSSNLSAKATLKVALDEKKADLVAAEEIAGKFRQDEANDIARASHMIKIDLEELKENIVEANEEIDNIKARLMSKKSGMKDIGNQNRDKEKLKELAKVVIDIKHRRQFPEKPIEIAQRLEQNLGLELVNTILNHPTSYNENNQSNSLETNSERRGIKVINETSIKNPVSNNEGNINVSTPSTQAIEQSSSISTIPTQEMELNTNQDLNINSTNPVINEKEITENGNNNLDINSIFENNSSTVNEIKGIEKDSLVNELDNYINNLETRV